MGERRMLNLALCSVVVRVEGADLRLSIEGAEYVCAYGSTAVCGGGELRM